MIRPRNKWELRYCTAQSKINHYARELWRPRLVQVEKIRVYHPVETRRYLKQHPCEGCGAASFCDTPCAVYLQWYNARIEAARIRAAERG